MLGLKGRAVVGAITVLLGVMAVAWLLLWYFIPTPPSTITMMSGFRNSSLDHFARDYRDKLAKQHVTLNLRYADSAIDNLSFLENPSSGVDATFVLGDVVDSKQAPGVRSLGRVTFNPVWIFYRGSEPIERLPQLQSKRIGANFNTRLIQDLMATSGLTAENTTFAQRAGPAAVRALREREVDALVLVDPPESSLVQPLLHDPEIRLMNVTQAEALTRILPYLNRLVLPSGVVDFKNNLPASDMNLVANGTSVVVREDLHPQLVHLFAQTLQEVHGKAGVLHKAGEFPTQTDPEFPMAEAALDFYRNGPSLLQRYMPYWEITFAKRALAVVLAVFAIVIPVLTYVPRLYRWLLQIYLRRFYRRLRAAEAELALDPSLPRLEALEDTLDSLDREAKSLPVRHSDLFFDFMMHVDVLRNRLAARVASLRSSISEPGAPDVP
jgi:TRAP-type uncharacterized transport system substrate-binding protein